MCVSKGKRQRRAAEQQAVAEAQTQLAQSREAAILAARGPMTDSRDIIAMRRAAISTFARSQRGTNRTMGMSQGRDMLGRSSLLGA